MSGQEENIMDEASYKKRLLERTIDHLEKELIYCKVSNSNIGQVSIFPIGETRKACMFYYPFTAQLKIPSIAYEEEGICIENVVKLFREHFKE